MPIPLTRPPRIHAGDVIGLVSPASPVADLSRIESGTRYLERNGFRVKVGTHVGRSIGYLAGTDQDRADDLHEMMRDPSVKAVFCLRGGYGVTRMLPLLDFELIRRNPKIIVGYSDVTALLLAVCARSSLITFHGPMVAVEFSGTVDPRTEESFWAMMFGTPDPRAFIIADPTTTHVLHDGQATGMLLGGNLSLLAAMAGTPYLPDFSKSILFLEEIGEEPYRVDRMVTQLFQAGILRHVGAVLTGQFTDCEPRDRTKPSLLVEEVLRSVSDALSVPFLAGCRFGHIASFVTIPVGVLAKVDTATSSVRFLESPTSDM